LLDFRQNRKNNFSIIEVSARYGAESTLMKESIMSKAGWPSTTGNPSGGGRDNNPPRK